MTVIQPNSISGITSITAQGDTINLYKSDGTTVGALNVNVNASSGVSTITNLRSTNINASGITTSAILNVGTGGTIITTTSNGNIGIGTTNPGNALNFSGITSTTTKLDVRGKTVLYNSTNVGYAATKGDMDTYAVLKLRGHASDSTNMQFAHLGNGTAMGVQVTNYNNDANFDIILNPFGGNIGIGSTSPTAKLNVVGNVVGNIVGLGTTNANTTLDFSTGNNFSLTLTTNISILNPSNLVAGQSGFISIVQDSGGSRTVGWGSYWDFPSSVAPTLTTTANGVDVIAYYVRTTSSIAADAIIGIGTL